MSSGVERELHHAFEGGKEGKDGQNGGLGSAKLDKTRPPDLAADLNPDTWGHLSPKQRLEMDAYSKERFMPRYSELLKQYYTTIAEKGRRKE